MTVIVVVDDRVTNRRILSRLAASLEDDILVKSFENPCKALEWVRSNTPDLVVTDFKMPEMDGAEFTRAFRSEPTCFDVPVMVVTVFEDRDFRYQALEAGATDFLLSPIDHREFRVRARNMLMLRNQQQLIKKRASRLEQRLRTTGKRHEEELRNSREQLLSVLDAVPAMIAATDSDARYIFINHSKAAFVGINPDDAVGKTPVDLFGEAVGRARMELDRWILETGECPPPFEEIITDRSGGTRILLTTKRPFSDAHGQRKNVVTVWLDITDRKQAENALAEQRHFLRAVIDNDPNWIYTTNQEGCITLANNAFAKACGMAVEDLEGQLYSTIGGKLDCMDQIAEDDRQMIAGSEEISRTERKIEFQLNEERWIQFTRVRFASTNGGIKVLTVGIDFTERVQAENALRHAKEQAETASRSKTEFLANMSHELRTPLNAIIGFSEMIENGFLGPVGNRKYLEYAHNIGQSGQHLLGIISDILEVSKIEAAGVDLQERELDVGSTIEDVLRIIGSRAEESEIEIETKIAKGVPGLRADERRLKQILLNLLSNAIKFTPAGGTIDINASVDTKGGVRIRVADNGIGIAPGNIARALERFGQLENVFTRENPGTGLGLPLAVGLMEQHGGHLDLKSKEGVGTTVTVSFPAERSITSIGGNRARRTS